jgi:formate dehydrogenase major subunit
MRNLAGHDIRSIGRVMKVVVRAVPTRGWPELQQEMFIEINPKVASEKGTRNGERR